MGRPSSLCTRIGVAFIARLLQVGEESSEIIAAYPHLAPGAVYDAMSYYLDHRQEIDQLIGDSPQRLLLKDTASKVAEHGRVTLKGS